MTKFWKDPVKHIGTVKQGLKLTVMFQSFPNVPKIKKLSSSCSCSVPKFNSFDGTLMVDFTPRSVPFHLRTQGWYETVKSIHVTYEDSTMDTLKLKAKVTR